MRSMKIEAPSADNKEFSHSQAPTPTDNAFFNDCLGIILHPMLAP